MPLSRSRIFALTILVCAGGTAMADPLGIASNYSAFVFNNFTAYGGSTQGPLAVGGNAEIYDANIATSLAAGNNLIVGQTIDLEGGTINGSAIAASNVTMNEGGTTGDVTTGGNFVGDGGPEDGGTVYYVGSYTGTGNSQQISSVSLPFSFSSVQAQLDTNSDDLAIAPLTGSYNEDASDDITFYGNNDGQNVFTIDDNTLSTASEIQVNIPVGATAVINVTDANNSGGTFLPDADFAFDPSAVLWNFNAFSSLIIDSFSGSILAPYANVTAIGGSLDGTIVANSILGSGDFNKPNNGNSSPVVPLPPALPASLLLFAPLAIRRKSLQAGNNSV